MNPVEFPGSTEIKKPDSMTDEECMSVYAMINRDPFQRPINYITAWKPNYEDLQALNRGEPIYICSLYPRLIPMKVFTINENGDSNDAG